MKKILAIIAIIFASTFSPALAQWTEFNRPTNPAPNFTLYGGPYTFIGLAEHVEFGGMAGVNMKDIFMAGPFYQYSIKGNHFYGLYSQINVVPKEYYFALGFSLKTGFINGGNKIAMDPGFIIQHNTLSDKIRFTHQIGLTGGALHYGFGILFGNFGEKYWLHPSKSTKSYKRKIRLSEFN